MNKLSGKIINIKSDDHLSIIELQVGSDIFKSIVIETLETAPFLKKDANVNALFKETEVSIAKNLSGRISLQNKMKCTIKDIKKGKLLSQLMLDYSGNNIFSIITAAAVEQLELKKGDEVLALVKTNEVMITPQ